MAVTPTDLSMYLNNPPDVTSDFLQLCINAAKSKARTAVVKDFKNNAQYDEFILALAANKYDNRGLEKSGTTSVAEEKALIDGYVLELRYATEDPSDDDE